MSPEFPFLFVEGNLGVPKKILYAIYLAAVFRLRDLRKTFLYNLQAEASSIRGVSSIILLANPAHQTALNVRKRLVQQHCIPATDELRITELIQRASSEGIKQSILWDHRRWLLNLLYRETAISPAPSPPHPIDEKSTNDDQCLPRLPVDTMRQELKLIRHACETYPRNYHAWCHWRYAMNTLCPRGNVVTSGDAASSVICVDEILSLRRWIERNVSEYSAIHQLCSVCHFVHGIACHQPVSVRAAELTNPDSLLEHALALVHSYPTHESLWIYLRAMTMASDADKRKELAAHINSSFEGGNLLMKSRFIDWLAVLVSPSSIKWRDGLKDS